jgi:hypothetical protein
MKKLQIYICLSVLFISCEKKLSDNTKKIVDQINQYSSLEYPYIGMYGAESDLYQLFDTLKQTASNKELVHLIDHKNTVLNGYSVWGLVDNKYNGLEYIFKRVLKSNKTLYTISFDVGSEEHLSHLLYSRLKSSLLSTDSIDSTYYLNKISIIDSLILYSNHLPGYYDREYGSYLRNSSLSNNDQDPETYNRVKYLALKEKDLMALVELAKYRYPSDTENILSFNEEAFEAISHFPHPDFWKFLESFKFTAMEKQYYESIAAYKNEKSKQLLSEIYSHLNKENANIGYFEELYEAVVRNYDPIYDSIIKKFWLEYKIIDFSTTTRLLETDPEKASSIFAEGLSTSKNLRFQNFLLIDYPENSNYGFPEDSILVLMLDSIEKFNPDKIPQVYRQTINSVNFLYFPTLIEKLEKERPQYIVKSLLKKLDSKIYAFESYHVSRILLLYNKNTINDQVIKILKRRQKYWDKGNWSTSFREMFLEFKISL